MKRFVLIVVFIAIAAWMYFAGTKPTADEGRFSIVNDVEFNTVFERARESTEQPVFDFDSGQALTSSQIADLKAAKPDLEKLIAYRPNDFGPYMMLAKTLRALGENDQALFNYQQALVLVPKDAIDPSVLWLAAEIKYDISSYYFERRDFVRAEKYGDEAALQNPGNAKFLSGAAQSKMVLKKFVDARRLTDEALKIGNQDPLAIQLDKELKDIGF